MTQNRFTSALGILIALPTANHAPHEAPPGPTSFPGVGITGAHVLQLSLVAYPPVPCGPVNLGFQNRNGVAVGPHETTPALQPGQAVALALNGNTLVAAAQ